MSGMSDTMSIINMIRVNDLSTDSKNQALQYDLDRRAEKLERRTGERPMDRDEFNKLNLAVKEAGSFDHALDWGWKGAVVGAVAMLVLSVLKVAAVGLGTGIAAGAAIGFLGASALSLFDDQKPEIRKVQLEKYHNYLDDFEKSHAPARAPELVVNAAEQGTKWRDHAEQSRSTQEVAR